jgi:hypothetical protein
LDGCSSKFAVDAFMRISPYNFKSTLFERRYAFFARNKWVCPNGHA